VRVSSVRGHGADRDVLAVVVAIGPGAVIDSIRASPLGPLGPWARSAVTRLVVRAGGVHDCVDCVPVITFGRPEHDRGLSPYQGQPQRDHATSALLIVARPRSWPSRPMQDDLQWQW